MVFSVESPVAGSSSQKPVQGGVELNDLWRVSNPSMPPQASPVVNRSGKVDHSQHIAVDEGLPNLPKVKCVLVGDGTIGKTSLVVSYTTNGYPTEYVPTAFDNYSVMVTVNDSPLRVQLCDTAGQDDFDALRPLCYPNTDIFLLCFSVVSPTSFHNINDKWVAEIRHHCPKVPILLVGTQCDLRNDVKVLIELAQYNDKPVTEGEARHKAQEIGALDYIECSALTQKHLKLVFDSAILAAVERIGTLGKKTHSGGKKAQKYKCSSDAPLLHNKGALALKSASPKVRTKHPKTNRPRRGWRKICCFA